MPSEIKSIYKKVKKKDKNDLFKLYKKEILNMINGDRDILLRLKVDNV